MTYVILLQFLLQQIAAPPYQAEIVVVAERGASERADAVAAVTVLDREEIAAMPANDLAEVLARVDGLRVAFDRGFGGAPMVSSRGFFGGGEVEYVQLIVDGIPVADAESGLADWRRLRAADLARVEVLRGPASSLYGDAALGGVIDVVTRRARGEGSSSWSVDGGSFGSAGAGGSFRGEIGASWIGLGANFTRTDGFREHAEEEHRGVDLSLRREDSRGAWAGSVSSGMRRREDAGPLDRAQVRRDRRQSDPLFRSDVDDGTRAHIGASFDRAAGRLPWSVSLHGSHRDSETTRTILLAPSLGDRARRTIESGSAGLSLQGGRMLWRGRLRFGADLSRDRLETEYRRDAEGERLAGGNGSRRRVALYAAQEALIGERVRVVAGARWDDLRDEFGGSAAPRASAVSPRAGINVQLGNAAEPLALFAAWGRAFKAPTLDQRFDPRPFPDFSGGSFTISNPLLEPQTARNIEIGVSRDRERDAFQIVAYRMDVDDEIDFDLTTFTYRNIGRSRHSGIELSARFREVAALRPEVGYVWTRVEPRGGADAGRQLKNIPEQTARAAVTAHLGAATTIRGEVRWTGRWFLDDANAIAVDPALVADLRVSQRLGRATWRVDLLNLLDEESSEAGFTLNDGGGGGVQAYEFPAAGFAARAGVEWRF